MMALDSFNFKPLAPGGASIFAAIVIALSRAYYLTNVPSILPHALPDGATVLALDLAASSDRSLIIPT